MNFVYPGCFFRYRVANMILFRKPAQFKVLTRPILNSPSSSSSSSRLRSYSITKTMSSGTKNICVAIVGVGLVGGEFINQLSSLASPHPFRIVSISSSKATVLAPNHEPTWPDWRTHLAQSTLKPDLNDLARTLSSLVKVKQDVVLVDNTSSDELAGLYPLLLNLGISVITPNKKAFSSSLILYDDILAASLETGARFFNEATVGAGLPIISTLKDLIATGDKVIPIPTQGD